MAGEEQEEGKDTGKCKREGESGMEDGKEGLGKEGGACKYTAVVFCSIFQLMQDKKTTTRILFGLFLKTILVADHGLNLAC